MLCINAIHEVSTIDRRMDRDRRTTGLDIEDPKAALMRCEDEDPNKQ
jgi:hypothetical protein